jgi:hypothetical protein
LDRVLVFQDSIQNACDIFAELDCLLSFAQATRTYNYRRPQMVEESIIEITGGRFVFVHSYKTEMDKLVEDIRYMNKFWISLCQTIPLLSAALVLDRRLSPTVKSTHPTGTATA